MEVSDQLHAPGEALLIPLEYEAEWASELVWTFLKK
jgi:hypothetical protein